MRFLEHFSFGSLIGLIPMYILARKENWRLFAPFAVFLCGIWAGLPAILSALFMPMESLTGNSIFNIFFFYPLIHPLIPPEEGLVIRMIPFAVLWIIYIFICDYYIKYAKELIRREERKMQDD